MIADINRNVTESELVSFADDTRIYSKIVTENDCDTLQRDLNVVYDWATSNNMFFNAQKFDYIPFSVRDNESNVYVNPNMNIIKPSAKVLDLGVYMSSNCSFDAHITNLCNKNGNLSGWILRTYVTRDPLTMLTLLTWLANLNSVEIRLCIPVVVTIQTQTRLSH